MAIRSRVLIVCMLVLAYASPLVRGFQLGDGEQQDFIPSYIEPLIQQCLIFDIQVIINANAPMSDLQQAIIRSYFGYCQNIMNIAMLVSVTSQDDDADGSQDQSPTTQTFDPQQQSPMTPDMINANLTPTPAGAQGQSSSSPLAKTPGSPPSGSSIPDSTTTSNPSSTSDPSSTSAPSPSPSSTSDPSTPSPSSPSPP